MASRSFLKTSIIAELANQIDAMTKSNKTKIHNRTKGHIAVVGAGSLGGWTASNMYLILIDR